MAVDNRWSFVAKRLIPAMKQFKAKNKRSATMEEMAKELGKDPVLSLTKTDGSPRVNSITKQPLTSKERLSQILAGLAAKTAPNVKANGQIAPNPKSNPDAYGVVKTVRAALGTGQRGRTSGTIDATEAAEIAADLDL